MFKSSIRNIFYPSSLERLSRFQFIIYTLTSWSILITLNDINLALSFILVINNTYVNINIGAKRIRDTGCKAIYFVLISLGLTLFSIITPSGQGISTPFCKSSAIIFCLSVLFIITKPPLIIEYYMLVLFLDKNIKKKKKKGL